MLTKIWRWLFEPKQWTIIEERLVENGRGAVIGKIWVLRNQFDDIKFKSMDTYT